MTKVNSIIALGEHVVLKTTAKSAGTEMKTASGIVYGIREQGEMPTICEVHAIGERVPDGLFEIGNLTPVPLGEKLNIMHPDVASGECEAKERDDKFISVHWRNIACIYK